MKNLGASARIVLLVIVSALPALAFTAYVGLAQRAAAEARALQELRVIAELTAKRPEQMIEGVRQLLYAVAGNAGPLMADRKLCMDYFLRLARGSSGLYRSMGIILPNGDVYCNSVAPDAGRTINVADRFYFRLATASRQFAVGEYQIGRASKIAGLNFAHPVIGEDGSLRAVVFAGLDLETFIDWGEMQQPAQQQGMSRVVTLFDRNGIVLGQYPEFRASVGKPAQNAEIIAKMAETRRGEFTATDLTGKKRRYAVDSAGMNPDGIAPIRVVVSMPEAQIFAASNRVLMDTVSGIVLVILVLVIIAWFGTEMVVMRRFRVMLDMAERVRGGDLDVRTGFGAGHEELTRLGNAMDDMVQELQNRDRQLREAMQRLGEQAVTDQLTGLPNRRYLWGALESELIRARRRKSPIAVMMLDIDHFKEFNDAHGHEAGDLVLKSVAGALRRVVRGSDIVARHGGEEFVIVLPEAGEASARARAEELRREIAALRLDYCGKPLETITLSVGIAVSADVQESAEALVRAADDAMYEAKRSGRDRVVFGKPESGITPQ